MGLVSGGMAIASCVVNDYFDLKIDASNAPDKPLPSGECRMSYAWCVCKLG
jgi:4-hydroxybenzoate polyprenyltransferase